MSIPIVVFRVLQNEEEKRKCILLYLMTSSAIVGCLTMIWSIVWLNFVSNRPSTDKFISEKEKLHLTKEINYVSEKDNEQVRIPVT